MQARRRGTPPGCGEYAQAGTRIGRIIETPHRRTHRLVKVPYGAAYDEEYGVSSEPSYVTSSDAPSRKHYENR